MVIRSIGNRWVDSRLEIVEIIKFLIDCGLFSKKFAEMNILTSKGIQTRFKLATERRRSGIIEYSLIGGGDDFAESVHENECGCIFRSVMNPIVRRKTLMTAICQKANLTM